MTSPSRLPNTGTLAGIPISVQDQAGAAQHAGNIAARVAHGLARLELLEVDFARSAVRNQIWLESAETENRHQLEACIRNASQTLQEVQERTRRMKTNYVDDMAKITGQLKHCVSEIGREVRSAQDDWMQIHSQMMAVRTWNTALPEAARQLAETATSGASEAVSPPQYHDGGEGDTRLSRAQARSAFPGNASAGGPADEPRE
ncbi:hypothetical protein A4X13_0g6491 [Tilletia indica]|uniref:Uncharacterized protein n=1 Tax=Tilletia indica TaxID=43049 RepID=A0A177TP14_9BASI|nr:hypothetical protein A4X13_0g6491 [Tilletia indica]